MRKSTQAPAFLAAACAINNVRFIHMSALGLSENAKSGFIRSKYNGEQAILKAKNDAKIVRVSLLDGAAGFGAKWIRKAAGLPIHFIMQVSNDNDAGLMAPLQVADLGEAIANICRLPSRVYKGDLPAIIELGGSEVMNMRELLDALRRGATNKPAYVVDIPKLVVRLASHIYDVLHFSPLSYGHFELMQGYNVPANNSLASLLKRAPQAVGISPMRVEPSFNASISLKRS